MNPEQAIKVGNGYSHNKVSSPSSKLVICLMVMSHSVEKKAYSGF